MQLLGADATQHSLALPLVAGSNLSLGVVVLGEPPPLVVQELAWTRQQDLQWLNLQIEISD